MVCAAIGLDPFPHKGKRSAAASSPRDPYLDTPNCISITAERSEDWLISPSARQLPVDA